MAIRSYWLLTLSSTRVPAVPAVGPHEIMLTGLADVGLVGLRYWPALGAALKAMLLSGDVAFSVCCV